MAPSRARSSVGVPRDAHSAPRRGAACRSTVEFAKYQGLGNDFILVDNRKQEEPLVSSGEAARLCDRNFGIGGDGVIFALPPKGEVDFSMRIFNSDGSEPEMCGNGIRCLARFVADEDGDGARTYDVATGAGLIRPEVLESGLVRVDMGEPILEASKVPTTLEPNSEGGAAIKQKLEAGGEEWLFTTVSMGNPHAVTYGRADGTPVKISTLALATVGPAVEGHAAFPARTNAEFVEVVSRSHVRMVVWERGAGPTLACGTGACATVVAGVLAGLVDRKATVDLPGGPLLIEWDEATNHVFMTGPGQHVFSGLVEV